MRLAGDYEYESEEEEEKKQSDKKSDKIYHLKNQQKLMQMNLMISLIKKKQK